MIHHFDSAVLHHKNDFIHGPYNCCSSILSVSLVCRLKFISGQHLTYLMQCCGHSLRRSVKMVPNLSTVWQKLCLSSLLSNYQDTCHQFCTIVKEHMSVGIFSSFQILFHGVFVQLFAVQLFMSELFEVFTAFLPPRASRQTARAIPRLLEQLTVQQALLLMLRYAMCAAHAP